MRNARLRDLAKVVRSKNSGPFEITFDVIFDDADTYQQVKDSGALTEAAMCRLYDVPREDILVCMFFDPALAFKMTLRRRWAQGSVGERDTCGTAQHAPLLDVVVG